MAGTWWMVLNLGHDRIVYRSRSCLDAFRVASNRSGGAARLARDDHFGIAVTGLARTLMVVPIGAVPRLPLAVPVERSLIAIPVDTGLPQAIYVEDDRPEVVPLSAGGTFMWIAPDGGTSTPNEPLATGHPR